MSADAASVLRSPSFDNDDIAMALFASTSSSPATKDCSNVAFTITVRNSKQPVCQLLDKSGKVPHINYEDNGYYGVYMMLDYDNQAATADVADAQRIVPKINMSLYQKDAAAIFSSIKRL